jgi:phosphohistidine phosphatase
VKLLTLIRHAKSSWKHAGLDDFDRPLNRRGERDAPVMGRRLASVAPLPERVIASPAVRAARTAELIAEETGLLDAIVFERALYLATPGRMLGVVQDLDDAFGHVALVSHNPGTTEFANDLADVRIDNVPTCGIVRLELEVDHWRDAAPGCARLLDFDYPKKGP